MEICCARNILGREHWRNAAQKKKYNFQVGMKVLKIGEKPIFVVYTYICRYLKQYIASLL